MTVSESQRALLATDRWAWLAGFVDRWYADPVAAGDGSTPDEIAAVLARVGERCPALLGEWFVLVGGRLQAVQDRPATPDTLHWDGDGVAVWTENQGVWALVAQPDGSCVLDDGTFLFPRTPLQHAVHSMLLSDTQIGAWAGTRVGPLGRLAPDVRGGFIEDALAEEVAEVTAAYPELTVPGNPFFGTPPRGDTATVLRAHDHGQLEWMTASQEAFDRLAALIPLDPPDGPQEVVVAFEDLTDTERTTLADHNGAPDTERFEAALGDLGHLTMGTNSAVCTRFHIMTSRSEEAIAAVRAVVPAELTGKVVIAIRPERIGYYQVVHPFGRHEYVLPD